MSNGTPSRGNTGTLLLTLLIAVVVIALFWAGSQILRGAAEAANEAPAAAAGTPEPWPTAPPTFTPLTGPTPIATLTAVPTATPIPLPKWEAISELSTVAFTLSSVQQASNDEKKLLGFISVGSDQVVIRAVGKVKMGVDLAELRDSDVVRDGNGITLALPPLKVLSVEMLFAQSEVISAKQRRFLSNPTGLEKEALNKAQGDLSAQITNNPEMLAIARELTQLRVQAFLESLGFDAVTVKFR